MGRAKALSQGCLSEESQSPEYLQSSENRGDSQVLKYPEALDFILSEMREECHSLEDSRRGWETIYLNPGPGEVV